MNVVSRVKCIVLTMSLTALLTVSQLSSGVGGDDDAVPSLECALRLLRLSLTESRSVDLLHTAASLLHCFSTLHSAVNTQVPLLLRLLSELCVCRCLCLYDSCSLLMLYCLIRDKCDSSTTNKMCRAENIDVSS